ncbi:threonine rich protein [Aspergillus heteromorphus CBS 117.55]|uniref:Threonine rich protein n=1 Tax=Aspergillus heteromorphus CBS 117.55 TaxID=1448321 RepID=A0A317VZ75_9EURO|nr:threonine rich protein [Aspergillus heteromorphus CBS 117.55]PWY78322.1 threonine rich protein [Aspergillus heteromorphus CBS 117.55]
MRFLNIIISIMAFAASALALTITQPRTNDQVDFSKPYTIKWTTAGSDPTEFSLVLVNMNSQPSVSKNIGNVKTSANEYTINKITGIPVAFGYQFNAISNTTTNTGILSQSSQFNVTAVGKVETTTSSTTSATQTAAAATSSSAGSASIPLSISGPIAVVGALAIRSLAVLL